MEKVFMDAPFAKVIETTEGGRQVYGWATLEVKDKSGEIADFNGTVKAFQQWSDETAKRTNNKNLGNVRLMHSPVAVGKTTYWEPRETTIQDDDGNDQTVKGIWVGAYIPPTKEDVIRDIDEGILSAFSIGGSYEKRWWDDGAQAFRYIPQLSEYSLVDNPCVPGASIEQVITKTDAPWNRKEGGEMSVELEKEDAPKGGDNTMTKGDGSMDIENVLKGYNITKEQLADILKALTPQDQPPAPVDAKTVDGDGDDDDNKEFPNPPSGDEKIDIAGAQSDVKASEKATAEKAAEVELEKADVVSDDDQPDDENCPDCNEPMDKCSCSKAEKSAPAELEKAGKSISNKNGVHLQHAANHINAVVKGADYSHEDHLVVESQYGQGGTGEEAPQVDVEKVFGDIFKPIIEAAVEATIAKALDAQMQKTAGNENDLAKGFSKAVDEVKTLVKGLASQEDLKKAVGELEAVKALVKEIHETPQAGGPLLNGGNPAFMMKDVSQANVSQMEEQALENLIHKSADPVVKDRLSQELAMRKAKQIFR